MGETGMTPEMFQQLPAYTQGHFFKVLYQRVLSMKMQPGGQEQLDKMIEKMNEPREDIA